MLTGITLPCVLSGVPTRSVTVRRPAVVLRAWADKEAKPQPQPQPQSEVAESGGLHVNYFTNLSLKAVNEASSGTVTAVER